MTEFVSLGFALVTPHLRQGWEDQSVPPVFYTPSRCLCDLCPATELLGWKKDSSFAEHCAGLGLTLEQGAELWPWLNSLFEAGRWGLDSVFVHLEDVQDFARRWAFHLTDLKILEMALPAAWVEEFLEAYLLENGEHTYQGRYFAALLKRSPAQGQCLGFEVLGVNRGEDHTSACSDVRLKFKSGFGAQFNEHGFLTTLEQAELAAREYMFEADGVGIENCDWFPVRVSQWALEAPHES